jgi:hypothetical protein
LDIDLTSKTGSAVGRSTVVTFKGNGCRWSLSVLRPEYFCVAAETK